MVRKIGHARHVAFAWPSFNYNWCFLVVGRLYWLLRAPAAKALAADLCFRMVAGWEAIAGLSAGAVARSERILLSLKRSSTLASVFEELTDDNLVNSHVFEKALDCRLLRISRGGVLSFFRCINLRYIYLFRVSDNVVEAVPQLLHGADLTFRGAHERTWKLKKLFRAICAASLISAAHRACKLGFLSRVISYL